MCIYCNINIPHEECKQKFFKDNKYFLWYYSIIRNATMRKIDKNTYYENHHIIPKSMGGSNRKFNMVELLPREHFLVHWLIIKCLIDHSHTYKMKSALYRMMGASEKVKKHVWSKWNYDVARKHLVEVNKIVNAGKSNPMYGRKHSQEAKDRISKGNSGLKRSDDHKAKVSAGNKGKIVKKETRDKIRKARIGTVFSDETLKRMKEGHFKTPRLKCPHCSIVTTPGNIKRWHENNCKSLRE
jgi:hypothetical protein